MVKNTDRFQCRLSGKLSPNKVILIAPVIQTFDDTCYGTSNNGGPIVKIHFGNNTGFNAVEYNIHSESLSAVSLCNEVNGELMIQYRQFMVTFAKHEYATVEEENEYEEIK